MKVVGLLSGGKDSCYNLCHCVRQGHEVVAVASLRPADGTDELDSYLYQTVGQDGIHLIADALQLPLYRRTIKGTAVELGSEYGPRQGSSKDLGVEGDETEDMYELLKEVKEEHPDVTGVSVGAILSSYQRVRVEHVCLRLGLTPLAYLWQRDQSELLAEMVAGGVEAVLIKVAGIGLEPKHLGKTLAEMQPDLERLHARYGLHVCGEGGEYETFTLDCPLFKKRIRLIETEMVHHPESSPMAPVAYLRIKRAELVEKDPVPTGTLKDSVAVPPLLDDEGECVEKAADSVRFPDGAPARPELQFVGDRPTATSEEHDGWISLASVTAQPTPYDIVSFSTLEDEVRACFERLADHLGYRTVPRHGSHIVKRGDLSHITHINLFLRSMSDFPAVNKVYSTFFGSSPPTRACVATHLPDHVRLMIDAIAQRPDKTKTRKALHVQGLSYWAPANIGPYSQAIETAGRLFIAGQIGLIPATLQLPSPPSFATEAALSLQHVRRILAATRPDAKLEHVICWLSDIRYLGAARAAWRASESIFDEATQVIYVEAVGLPRGAQVEWQVLAKYPESTGVAEEEDEPAPSTIPPRSVSLRIFRLPSVSRSQAVHSLEDSLTDGVAITDICVNAIARADGPADVSLAYVFA